MSGNLNLDDLSKSIALTIQTHLDLHCEAVKNFSNTLGLSKSLKSSISEELDHNNNMTFTSIYKLLTIYTENFKESLNTLNPDSDLPNTQITDNELEYLNQELAEQKQINSQLRQDLRSGQKQLSELKNYLSVLDHCKSSSEAQLLSKLKM